jgi:RNA polymerase sigma factor (sigma-70 family)
MTISKPRWVTRLFQGRATPADLGARLQDASETSTRDLSNSQLDELSQVIFDRLTQISDAVAEQDPQGQLFRVATKVCEEMSASQREQLETFDPEVTSQYMRAAVQRLKPREREVLLLHVSEGLTYKQIAERLQVSTPLVLRNLTSAYTALRAQRSEV